MRRELTLMALVLAGAASARAEDEPGLADIDVGSRRIGGPGLTAAERAGGEDEVELTEETLPPKGHPKRMPGLLLIARRYARGQDYKTACDRYDQIVDEGGVEALDGAKDARELAAKSYLGCAEQAFPSGEFEKVEALLKKSERLGPKSFRHDVLRRKMTRETYRKELAQGATDRAVETFQRYHAEQPDEDERIWLGNELAKLAWAAHREKRIVDRDHAMRLTREVAPQNPELRKLAEELDSGSKVFGRVGLAVAAGVALTFVGTGAMKIYARRRVREDIDDDDVG